MDFTLKPRGFLWEHRYETGLPEIDAQHRELVALINRLIAQLGEPGETGHARHCIVDLVAYASRHFECEEALMERHDLGAHEAEHALVHRRFAGFVLDQADRVGREPGVAIDIARFLVSWLVHHILQTDQKMAALIRASLRARAMSCDEVFV